MKKTVEDRFWEKVVIRGKDECWEWTSHVSIHGYGVFWLNGKNNGAHRVSYVLANGEIPKHDSYHGFCVIHSCDNRKCVNPAHLSVGTTLDNVKDKIKKGRAVYSRGSKHGMAKLSELSAQRIRIVGTALPAPRLANILGVNKSVIDKIRNNRNWKHLTSTKQALAQ